MWKEVAKFACGFEAFHALMHAYLWLSGTTISFGGVTATPNVSAAGVFINAAIAAALGVYAWGRQGSLDRRDQTKGE